MAYINYNSSDAYKVERALIYEIAGKTDDFITACEELYKKGTVGIKNTLVNEKKNTDVLLLRSTNITE